jgi:hypothetical protein
MGEPKITNTQGRSILGTGGALNTHHEGPTKRPTEEWADRKLEQGGANTSPKKKESPMNNPNFGKGGSESAE